MGTRIQRLLHPGGFPATTGQEMVDCLKKTLEYFSRGGNCPLPLSIHGNPPSAQNQKPNEASKPSTPIRADVLVPKALEALSPYIAPNISRSLNLSLQTNFINHIATLLALATAFIRGGWSRHHQMH